MAHRGMNPSLQNTYEDLDQSPPVNLNLSLPVLIEMGWFSNLYLSFRHPKLC
jgi:hypothetical protein